MREFADLARRVAELERRAANGVRDGTVEEIDAGAKRVRLRLGGDDDKPFLSPWVPYAQHAGALKIHAPPSVGQQMTLISPAGDLRGGRAFPFTWSDAEPSPSDAADSNVITFGDMRIELLSDQLRIAIGDTEIVIEGGRIHLKAAQISTDGEMRLDGGQRAVVFAGSADSAGDVNAEGAARVFV